MFVVLQCPNQKVVPNGDVLMGGKELSHCMNTCGLCTGVGHNIATCPLKENIQCYAHTKN